MTYVLADTSLTEELEQLELAEGTETKRGGVEGRDLLDGDLAPRWPVDGRADNTIRALTDDIQNLILSAYGLLFSTVGDKNRETRNTHQR